MIGNKTEYQIQQSLTSLLWQFVEEVCLTFVAIVFAIFVDTISKTDIISSHVITEVSAILFKYLLFSKTHELGFQLYSFLHLQYYLHSHWQVLLFHLWFELHVFLLNLHLQSYGIRFVIVWTSILFGVILNAFTFMSFGSIWIHIVGDNTLELPLHLPKLIMTG